MPELGCFIPCGTRISHRAAWQIQGTTNDHQHNDNSNNAQQKQQDQDQDQDQEQEQEQQEQQEQQQQQQQQQQQLHYAAFINRDPYNGLFFSSPNNWVIFHSRKNPTLWAL